MPHIVVKQHILLDIFDANTQGGGLGYRCENLKINNLILKFETWVTLHWVGKFDPLIKVHIKETNGFLLLFNLSNKESFNNLKKCYILIKENILDLSKIPILLLGIHADKDNYMVNIDSIIMFARENNFIGYIEISSLEGKNVKEAYKFLAYCIYQINIKKKDLTDIKFKLLFYK